MWDLTAALKHLDAHAGDSSLGKCAQFVRKAVEAGGLTLERHISAKDYGSSFIKAGFQALASTPTVFTPGDVAIIQPIPGHPHGHICMFNGTMWKSDFKQPHGYYPGPTYRKLKPAVTFYRYPMRIAAPPMLYPHVHRYA